MARVKFIRDEEPNILALSSNKKVIDGALYVATDTGSMWLGVAENRLLQINAANLDKDTTYTIYKSGNIIFFQDSNGTVTKITDDNTVYDDATDTTAGLMSAADKKKLDSIQEGANKYELPVASSTTLGGVKVGKNLTIAEDGTLAATVELEKEVSDRKAADTALGKRVDAEATAREEADNAIVASIGTKAETSALEKEVSDRKAMDIYLTSLIDNAISQGLTVIKTTSKAKSIGADALDKLIKSWPQVILIRTNRLEVGDNTGRGFMCPLERTTSSYLFYSPKVRNSVDSKPYYEVVKISNSGEGKLSNLGLDMAPIYWASIDSKPFITIGSGLKVVSDALSVDTSALPSGLTAIAIGDTSTAADVYAKVQAAWPNCVLSGDTIYYPYAELPAVGPQAHAYLFTANGGGATSAWIVNATSMTHKSDIIATLNSTWGEIEQT